MNLLEELAKELWLAANEHWQKCEPVQRDRFWKVNKENWNFYLRLAQRVQDKLSAKDAEIERLVQGGAYWKQQCQQSDEELCKLESALGFRECIDPKLGLINTNDGSIERIRDLIAKEGQLGDLLTITKGLAERLRGALDWMESDRASGDSGFWDWQPGDQYTEGAAALSAYAAFVQQRDSKE